MCNLTVNCFMPVVSDLCFLLHHISRHRICLSLLVLTEYCRDWGDQYVSEMIIMTMHSHSVSGCWSTGWRSEVSDTVFQPSPAQLAEPSRAASCPAWCLGAVRSLHSPTRLHWSASGTFLPLGQFCVYFQGEVFFPGLSWPPNEGFWLRSTLHKRPRHSSCLRWILCVSSC